MGSRLQTISRIARQDAVRTAGLPRCALPAPEIRAEVQSLLANADDADTVLNSPAIAGARAAIETALKPPDSGREALISELTGAVTIADRYQIVECIGKGGQAIVLLAIDRRIADRKVVVKVLDGEQANRDWMEKKFRQEIEVLAKINHSRRCRSLRLRASRQWQAIPRDELRRWHQSAGTNAHAHRSRRDRRDSQADGIGLNAAHALGVVHRDLKPENVMLTRSARNDGGKDVASVKLIDFGIARTQKQHSADETITNTMVAGTASYMAPEQFTGVASPASDIYAMGVICFEMLTGSRPQVLAPGHELPSGVGPRLTAAFAHEPTKRPADAEAFGNSLSATLLGRKPERKRMVALISAAAIALLAAGVYFWPRAHAAPLTDKDVLVLADFTNRTGDAVFDGTLREGLAVALEQSPFLKIMSDDEINQVLKLMGRRPGEHITNEIAREICQRANEKATIGGSIASIGKSYAVTLLATNCATGEALAHMQVEAESKERVLKALSAAATQREASLGRIAEFDQEAEPAVVVFRDYRLS